MIIVYRLPKMKIYSWAPYEDRIFWRSCENRFDLYELSKIDCHCGSVRASREPFKLKFTCMINLIFLVNF